MSESPGTSSSSSNRSPRMSGCTITALVALGLIAVIIFALPSLGVSLVQGLVNIPGQLFNRAPAAPTNVALPAVINQIKPLGQLHTTSYFLSTVVDTQMQIGALNQTQRVLLVACGKVDAGVDLSKLQQNDILTSGDKVVIRLPETEIFTSQVFDDRKCTYVVLREEGILLPPNLQLESAAREAAVANFKETALQNGILDQARTNAQGELRRLLTLLGYRDIQFASTPRIPSTDQ